jgi:hypothetical protein
MVDDPPQLPELGGHVLIAIATELLAQDIILPIFETKGPGC